jgi:hypothetical protein
VCIDILCYLFYQPVKIFIDGFFRGLGGKKETLRRTPYATVLAGIKLALGHKSGWDLDPAPPWYNDNF